MNPSQHQQTCTISGPRPHRLPAGPRKISNIGLLRHLEQIVLQQIAAGYTIFQSGMSLGLDIWAAELILRLRKHNPQLRLHAFLPYETQAAHWPERWRALYFDILACCDQVAEVPGGYWPGCLEARNRRMIDACTLLIAVEDECSKSETAYLRQYAARQGLRVITVSKFF